MSDIHPSSKTKKARTEKELMDISNKINFSSIGRSKPCVLCTHFIHVQPVHADSLYEWSLPVLSFGFPCTEYVSYFVRHKNEGDKAESTNATLIICPLYILS